MTYAGACLHADDRPWEGRGSKKKQGPGPPKPVTGGSSGRSDAVKANRLEKNILWKEISSRSQRRISHPQGDKAIIHDLHRPPIRLPSTPSTAVNRHRYHATIHVLSSMPQATIHDLHQATINTSGDHL
eukprot:gene12273-15419_t